MNNKYNFLYGSRLTSCRQTWQKKAALLLFFVLFSVIGVQGQNVTVAGAVTGNGSYATLAAAFTAIGTSQGGANIVVTVTGDTTEASIAILGAGTWSTLTINPSGARTITGSLATELIQLNGADNVTIDGLNASGNSLTISNTSTSATSGTSTIKFQADATNNTITKCSVLGSTTVPLATNGGVIFFSTASTSGNDNNTISNCNIGPAGSNLPSKLIFGNGSTTNATIANSNVTVTNCNLYDFFLAGGGAGVYASSGNTNWNVTNNKIYQTASRTITGSMYGVYFVNTTYGDNVQVTGNTIGYASNSGTGTFTLLGTGSFVGVNFNGQTSGTNANNLNNNIISDISFTSTSGTFYGIYNLSGASANTVNINGNTIRNIGLVTTTGSAYMIHWTSATNVSVSNNTVYGVTRNGSGGLYGLYSGSSSVNETVSGNTVYNLSNTGASSNSIYGIYQGTASGTKLFQNNTVYNLTGNGGMTIYGLYVGYGTTLDMSGNTIYGLTNTGGTSGTIYGIGRGSSATTADIYKNKVYGLSSTSTGGVLYGLYLGGGTTTNTYNNIIGGLTMPAVNSAFPLVGIYISGGTTSNVYYNTVRIPNGTSTGALFGSATLYASTTPTLDLRNNILVNASTPTGAGIAAAYRRSSTTLTTYAATSNNNLFFGTSGVYTDGTNTDAGLAAFQTRLADSRDSASKSQNPTFASLIGANANFLNFTSGTVSLAGGTAQVLASPYDTDFSGATRSATVPDMGGFEFTEGVILLPTITGFTPSTLCVGGGQSVTITGTHLDTLSSVLFNGASGVTLVGTITSSSPTSITVTTPASIVDGIIRVVNSAGSGDSSSQFSVVLPPTIGVSSGATICSGASTSLTGTGGNTYAWSPATGLSATTGVTVTASPTATTTYTVTGTSTAGCTATNTVTVTVNPVASAVTVTKNPTTACLGGITTLTVTGGTVATPASNYGFAASSGTYTPLTGGTAVSAIKVDTGISGAIPLGFSFSYAGGTYTNVYADSNGLLTFNASATSTTSNTMAAPSASILPFIAPLWDDLDGLSTGAASYLTTGTSGNRIFTFEWLNWEWNYNADAATISFQVKLYEADGKIEFIYRPDATAVVSPTASAGLGGATVGNYLSLSDLSSTATASSTTPSNSIAVKPVTGQVFTFTRAAQPVLSWSPTTDLFTDAAATIPYTSGTNTVLYSKSNTPQTYTATATLGTCPVSGSATVTPNALPTITASGSAAICAGGTGAALTATGGTSYAWTPTTGLSAANVANPTATPGATTTYTVTGTDANGCKNTATAVVTVNNPVVITGQPANVTAIVGSTNTFTVTATATGITYQWQVDTGAGFGDIIGETTASLTVTATVTASYRCVVSGTSPCTPVTSNAATLTISAVSFSTQPQPQTICSNTNATFSVTAAGAVTSYQWEYSTNSGSTWTALPGETTNTLVLTGQTSGSSGYLIRCVLNGGVLNSNPALLTVYDVVAIPTPPSNQTVCAGTNATFTAIATGSGLTYQWQVSTNGGASFTDVASAGSTASYTVTSPTAAQNNNQYRVIVTGTAPCSPVTSAAATLTVTDVTVAATLSSFCIGGSTTLNATFVGLPDNTTATWSSTAGSGASTPVSGTSATVTPTVAGSYIYTFTSNGTCPLTKTVAVTVNALPNITSVTATPASVCSGATVNLAAQSIGIASGIATIGAGATTSATYSNPFYSAWSNTHTQHIILASELTAMGLKAGNITSVALDVTGAGTLPMIDLSVKIGTTVATTMAAFVSNAGFQTVYTNASLLPTVGVNTLTFSTPFNWNGTSNLVLEFCHGNSGSTSTMSRTVKADNTTYVSSIKAQVSAATASATICGDTTTNMLTYSTRPQFKFAGQLGTDITSTYTWSWNSSPAVSTATGTTSVTNTTGTPITQTFTATATSAAGCPASLTTSAVTINSTIPAPTGTDSTQCGTGTPTASVAGSGRSGATFKWYTVATGGTALAGQSGSTLVAPYTIAATTTFYVSEVSADGLCESPRTTVNVTVTAPLAFTLSSGTATNCSGSASLTPVTIATNGGYTTYAWSNSATVSGNETTGWTFSPTATTTYTLTASGGGCSTTATVVVTPTALPVVTATASPAAICVGASSTLTALTNIVGAGEVTFGTDTTLTSATAQPTAFCNRWGSYRMQTVYTAAELQAAGLRAGNITSMAFNITTLGDGATNSGFEVKIGNTASSTLSGDFTSTTTGFTTVYPSQTYTHTATGWQTIPFSTPFSWNGTSNIIVEVIHSGANSTNNSITYYTATTGTTVAYTTTASTNAASFSTNRLNVKFGGQALTQGLGTLAYTWNDPLTTSGNVLTVSPAATTTYTVSGYNSTTGCTGTATSTVTVYTPPTAPAVTSAIQCGPRVPLVSVADTNGYTTPTFKWYADNVTTTALQTSTSTTYTTSVSTTTTFYVSVLSPGGCESPRTAVTTTVVLPAMLTVSPAVAICTGGNTVLTANGASTYVWSPALGLSSTTGASVTATPATTTTYSVTGTDANGCTTTAATVAVTVNTYPTAVTASASAAVCQGGTINLTASATGPANTLANFSEGFETFPPTGWTMLNPGSGSPWQATNVLEPLGVRSGTSSMAYYYNTDFSGNAWAISPSQALTAGVPYTVSFWYRVPATLYTEKLKLTVGTSNTVAAQTTTLLNYPSLINIQNFTQATVTFTPTVTGVYYFGLNAFSTADQDTLYIDDFTVTGGAAAPVLTYAWTSTPSGFTSSVQNPTGVVVTENTTYTVTASNGSCGTTATTSLVTPTALPVFTASGDVTICKGLSTTLSATEVVGYTYAWSPALGLNTTTSATVTASPTTTTTYTVEVTETATGCKKSLPVVVTVSEPGAINPIGTTTSRLAVENGSTTFTVATVAGTTYTYQWQVNTGSGWSNLLEADLNYENVTSATLTITNIPGTFNGYLYQCLVTGAAPCATLVPTVVTLRVSNTGVETPPANVTVCTSNPTASFTVVTNGDAPDFTYWKMSTDGGITYNDIFDGTDSITGLTFSGTDTTTLNVSDITLANSGIKFLLELNFELLSDSATLTVKRPVSITGQPSNQTVCVTGGTATFSTTATGDDLTYQWQFSTNGGSSWTNYAGADATSNSISILNPALGTNGYQYHVIVSGNAACGSATSNAATLNINNPTITSQPIAATVIRGNTATFTVAASAATGYQWEYSTNGSTGWSPLAALPAGTTYTGATSATLSVVTSDLTATGTANYYRCVVTNAGCTVTSAGAQMTVVGYCIPNAATASTSYFDAFSTSGGSTSIDNSGSGFSTNGYGNFTGLSASHILGSSVSYATTLVGTTVGVAIWVDWNQNGTFETTERVANTTGYVSVFTGSFAVPMTATLGTTRMRIMMDYNNNNPSNPCTRGATGEVEDYTFIVLPQPACEGRPIAGTASAASSSLCSGGTGTTLTLTGSTTGVTGISYQWYSSTDNVTFAPVSGQTTTTLATGSLTAAAYYKCAVTCINGGLSADSNTVTITVSNPLITGSTPGAVCGAGSVTLGATANAGSTINWYAAATGGTALGTGASFTTPSIAATTTYYAEATAGGVSANLGRLTQVGGSGTNLTTYGQDFTVTQSVKLDAVDVISTTGTSITISLYNSTGTVQLLTKGAVAVGVGTTQTINLGWDLAPGTYRLVANGMTGNFIRENSGPVYPIVLTGVGQINGFVSAIAGTVTTSASYYFMYNWKMTTGCQSTRTPVIATVGAKPTATISYAGSPYCFNAAPVSATLTGTNAYTGGTYTASPIGLSIDATTGAIDPSLSTAGTYTVTYTTNATAYCTPQTATATVTVNPSVLNAGFTYANATYCTNSASASPTVTGFAGTFTAVPTGLSINAVTGAINFATSTPGSYTVSNTVSACSSSDVVTFGITVNQAPVITTQPASVTVCASANASFTVAASGTGVTYQWEVNSGSGWATVSNGGVYSNANTATLSITAATVGMNTYQYRAIVSDTSGCGTLTSSVVTLTVSQPAAPIFSPVNPSVCPGGIQALTVTNALQGNATLGTGTLASGTTSYPNPLSAYYGGTKHQMLYTATELQAQGLGAGSVISSIKFDLSTFAANACTDFTIRMGTTANTALTGFVTGTTAVYGPTTFTPSATGMVTFTLSTPFTWNGTSNLIVETVHNAGNGGNGSGTTNKYTATTGNTVFYGATDNVAGGIAGFDALTSWTSTGASANRPNTIFGYNLGTTTWSPITGLYTNAGATTAYTGGNAATVYAKPTSTTTYTATNTNLGSCSNSATTTVTVLPAATLASITQSSITCAGSPMTFSLTGLIPNSTSRIAYTVNGVAATPITGVVANASGAGSFNLSLGGFTNGQPLVITAITRTDVVPATCATPITANNTVTIAVLPNHAILASGGSVNPTLCIGSALAIPTVYTVSNGGTGAGVTGLPSGMTGTFASGNFTISGTPTQSGSFPYTVTTTGNACNVAVANGTITVTPLQTPTVALTSSDGDNTFAYGTPVTFTATASSVVGNTGIVYDFKVNGVSKQSGASASYVVSNLANNDQVSVSIVVTGGDCMATNVATSASITNTVTGAVLVYISNYCGQTLPWLSAPINSTTAVVSGTPTVQYQFRVKRVGGASETLALRSTPSFNLTQTSLYAYNASYEVYVAAVINGVLQPESTACIISTPTTVPVPAVQTTYCGNTLADAYAPIFAGVVPGATGYSFDVYQGATHVTTVTRDVPYFYLTSIPGWTYNTVYTVFVAVKINDGVYGPYGASCTVSTPQLATPGLIACGGAAMTSVSNPVFTTGVPGATNYSFEVSGPGITTTTINRTVPYFYLTSITGWNYGTVYTVKVTVTKGSEVGPQSAGCTLTTPAIPSTAVRASQCGVRMTNAANPIFADAVYGATEYRFTVTDGVNSTQIVRSVNYFYINTVSFWQYNTDYTVSVEAKRNTGSFSPIVTTCTVTTPDGPMTTIPELSCNNPTLTTSGVLSVDAYPGATSYMFIVELYNDLSQLVGTYTKVRYTNSVTLNMFPGLAAPSSLPGVTYSWGVQVAVMGKYGEATKGCSFTLIPTPSVRMAIVPFSATAYPNPFANNFMLDVKTNSQSVVNVKVYDMVGRLIEQREVRISDLETTTIGDRYPSGVYNVVVTQEDNVETVRVIKR